MFIKIHRSRYNNEVEDWLLRNEIISRPMMVGELDEDDNLIICFPDMELADIFKLTYAI